MGRVIRYRGTSPSLFPIVVHHRNKPRVFRLHESSNIKKKKSFGVKGVARGLYGRA